jgi:hypothetical protein
MMGVASAAVHMATLSERLASDPMEESQDGGARWRDTAVVSALVRLLCTRQALTRAAAPRRAARSLASRAAQRRSRTAWPSARCRRR